MATKHIVKRKGHSEPFDTRKLYASIYAVCLSVRTPEGEAELVADRVVKHVNAWLEPKHEVTAHDIRTQAAKHLKAYNPDASYLYSVHKDMHK